MSAIDAHVGARLRLRRRHMGLSQTELGRLIGLTFQQIQKYERGANRISAGRLYQFADVLGVPVSYFFEGVGIHSDDTAEGEGGIFANGLEPYVKAETLELVQLYYQADSPELRKRIFDLVKSLADQ